MASSRSNLPHIAASNAAYRSRNAKSNSSVDGSPLDPPPSQRRAGHDGDDDATSDVEMDGNEGRGEEGEGGEGGIGGGVGGNVDAFDDDRLSELEREVLREWRRLNGNLVEVSVDFVFDIL